MQPVRPTQQKCKAFIGAVAGHLIEWYGYGVYGFVTSYVAEYGGPERRGLATSLLMTVAVSGLILGSIVANRPILNTGRCCHAGIRLAHPLHHRRLLLHLSPR